MKSYVLLCLVVFTINVFSHEPAQSSFTGGVLGGLNLANISGDDVHDTEMKIGFSLGCLMDFPMRESFSIRPEIHFIRKGYEISEEEYENDGEYEYRESIEGSVSLNYIEIPVFGVFSLNKNIRLIAGPYMEFFMDGKASMDYEFEMTYPGGHIEESGSDSDKIESKFVNTPGFGLILGFEFALESVFFSFRYSMGLSDIPDDPIDMKHQNYQILIGYSFNDPVVAEE